VGNKLGAPGILLGFRPQWRGQPFGSFKILFSAALYGSELARAVRGSPDFWTAPVEKVEATEPKPGGTRPL